MSESKEWQKHYPSLFVVVVKKVAFCVFFFLIMCVVFWLYYSAKLLPVMQNSLLENGRAVQN